MRDDFEDQYCILFAQGRTRLLRLLKIKNLAIKFYNTHHEEFAKLGMNPHIDAIDPATMVSASQETVLKDLKDKVRIEPVDIREIDEESMAYDINNYESSSLSQHSIMSNQSDRQKLTKTKSCKKSIFKRSNSEK